MRNIDAIFVFFCLYLSFMIHIFSYHVSFANHLSNSLTFMTLKVADRSVWLMLCNVFANMTCIFAETNRPQMLYSVQTYSLYVHVTSKAVFLKLWARDQHWATEQRLLVSSNPLPKINEITTYSMKCLCLSRFVFSCAQYCNTQKTL